MKKKSTSYSERIKYLYVYRDDLEEIYNLFKRYSEEVKFEVDDFELDSIDELGQIHTEEAKSVRLSILEPIVSISLDNFGAYILSFHMDINAEAIINKLTSILNKRKRKFIEFSQKYYGLALSLFIIFGMLFLFLHDYLYPYLAYFLLFFFGVFALINTINFYISFKKTDSKIFLNYKKDRPSFLERNRDEIIVGTIMLVLGAIIGKFF